MTQQELLQSLNTEQGAALNKILEENFTLRGNANEIAGLKKAVEDGNEQRLKLQAEFDEYKFQASAAMDLTNSGANDAIAALKSALAKAQADFATATAELGAFRAEKREREKPERQKQREAILVQKAELEKQLDALADAAPVEASVAAKK